MHQYILKLNLAVLLFTVVSFISNAQNKDKMEASNKMIIRHGFVTWTNGTGNFFDLLEDNVQWEITGSTALSKTYTSKKQFMNEVILPLNKRLSVKIKPSVRDIYADGDMVIALWDGNATATDGKPYRSSYSWYMKMKRGKITHVVAFLDGREFDDIMKRIPVKN